MKEFHKKESPVVGYAGFGGGVTYFTGAAVKTYVDDVFSTFLYGGSTGAQPIPNGVDLTEGGLIWIKKRDTSGSHSLTDTVTGINKNLITNNSNQQATDADRITTVSSGNGFTLYGNGTNVNTDGDDFVSWTFRKAPGFFDVVTFNGDPNNNPQNIPHSLGSVPGFIIVKRTDDTGPWLCYHRSLGNTKNLELQEDNDEDTNTSIWNSTTPTSTHFTVGSNANVNGNGRTFVAYIFAHDDSQYGTGGNESIIKCGTYTGGGSTNVEVNLGFEPQFVLLRCSTRSGGYAGGWYLFDSMRGINTGSTDPTVQTQETNEEDASTNANISLTPTGFITDGEGLGSNADGGTYIYVAIRRPNKPPGAGTEVYETVKYTGNSTARIVSTSIAADTIIAYRRSGSQDHFIFDRLRGSTKYLRTSTPGDEANQSTAITTIGNNFLDMGGGSIVNDNQSVTDNMCLHMFRRAPGFMDVVAYSGTLSSSGSQTVPHNLGKIPELILVKRRSASTQWYVYSNALTTPLTKKLVLNDSGDESDSLDAWGASGSPVAPNEDNFTVGYNQGNNGTGSSGSTYIAYLFATLSGVSMVGSYDGDTNNAIDVDCGFASNARFIMIKRTNSPGGDWYVWDSVRGIVSGNDPYSLLNATAAEVANTDYVDAHPSNAGFRVNSGTSGVPAALNETGGKYLFLAIA